MKFSNFSTGLTYADVQVGLDPSEGSGLVTLDSDCNGVFKITNKDTQKLKVVQTDGTWTKTQVFDLSGLTLEAVNTVSPTTATFDLNTSGANYGDKVFTVTPASSGATVSKLFDDDDDEIPKTVDELTVWSVDNTGLIITLTKEYLSVAGAAVVAESGDTIAITAKLTDNSTVDFTVAVEDTT